MPFKQMVSIVLCHFFYCFINEDPSHALVPIWFVLKHPPQIVAYHFVP